MLSVDLLYIYQFSLRILSVLVAKFYLRSILLVNGENDLSIEIPQKLASGIYDIFIYTDSNIRQQKLIIR
jgi:hypothetical protein